MGTTRGGTVPGVTRPPIESVAASVWAADRGGPRPAWTTPTEAELADALDDTDPETRHQAARRLSGLYHTDPDADTFRLAVWHADGAALTAYIVTAPADTLTAGVRAARDAVTLRVGSDTPATLDIRTVAEVHTDYMAALTTRPDLHHPAGPLVRWWQQNRAAEPVNPT